MKAESVAAHISGENEPAGSATAALGAEQPVDGLMGEERRTQILQIVRSTGGFASMSLPLISIPPRSRFATI